MGMSMPRTVYVMIAYKGHSWEFCGEKSMRCGDRNCLFPRWNERKRKGFVTGKTETKEMFS